MVGLNGYTYGLALLCLFFMLRAQGVFAKTAYRLNRSVQILFMIGLGIQLLTPIGFTYHFLSGWDEYNRTWALRYFNLFTWTNICSSIGVLIVFVRRILSLSKIDDKHVYDANVETNIQHEIQKVTSKTQNIEKDLLTVVIRYLICASTALLSTLVVVMFGIIRSEVSSFHSQLILRGLHLGFHILDCTINLICLSLQFPFGKSVYRACCSRIDVFVSNCFLKALKLQINANTAAPLQKDGSNVDTKSDVATDSIAEVSV